jgi:hypothetical protein
VPPGVDGRLDIGKEHPLQGASRRRPAKGGDAAQAKEENTRLRALRGASSAAFDGRGSGSVAAGWNGGGFCRAWGGGGAGGGSGVHGGRRLTRTLDGGGVAHEEKVDNLVFYRWPQRDLCVRTVSGHPTACSKTQSGQRMNVNEPAFQ